MNILKDLPELVQAKVLTQKTADNILDYYKKREVHQLTDFLLFSGFWVQY